MKLFCKCERCKRDEQVKVSFHVAQQGLQFGNGYNVAMPEYWQEIDGHLLCAQCVKQIREVIGVALSLK